jgi:hypothetical protein
MDCLFNGELEDRILELKNANHFLGSKRPCKRASPPHRVEQRLGLQPDQRFPYRRLTDPQAIGQLADDELLARRAYGVATSHRYDRAAIPVATGIGTAGQADTARDDPAARRYADETNPEALRV